MITLVVQVHQLMRQAANPAAGLLLFQRVDQFDRGVEAHALAVARHRFDAERGGQMRLAGAGPADQDEIFRLLGEGGRGEAADLAAIDLGLVEVEAGEIAVNREARDVHLVAYGARGAIGGFGLHQLGEAPRGRCHHGLPLLEAVGVAGGHAVQPQAFEVGDERVASSSRSVS
jgi:hypothetical protein